MSDTPETDAMEYFELFGPDRVVEVEFARKLERERNAAIADLNILCDRVLELNTLLQAHGIIEYGN